MAEHFVLVRKDKGGVYIPAVTLCAAPNFYMQIHKLQHVVVAHEALLCSRFISDHFKFRFRAV